MSRLVRYHHHVPAYDVNAERWKRLVETLLSQLSVDLLERFRLTMLEENAEQKCALRLGSLLYRCLILCFRVRLTTMIEWQRLQSSNKPAS
jgi:hypothetical protein